MGKKLAPVRRSGRVGCPEVDCGFRQCVAFAIEFLQERKLGPGFESVLVPVDVLVVETGAQPIEGAAQTTEDVAVLCARRNAFAESLGFEEGAFIVADDQA